MMQGKFRKKEPQWLGLALPLNFLPLSSFSGFIFIRKSYWMNPDTQFTFSLCFSSKWQIHGGHLVLPRQAGHLHWLMFCSGKEKLWRNYNGESTIRNVDVLISVALNSWFSFGDEIASGVKFQDYWCKIYLRHHATQLYITLLEKAKICN